MGSSPLVKLTKFAVTAVALLTFTPATFAGVTADESHLRNIQELAVLQSGLTIAQVEDLMADNYLLQMGSGLLFSGLRTDPGYGNCNLTAKFDEAAPFPSLQKVANDAETREKLMFIVRNKCLKQIRIDLLNNISLPSEKARAAYLCSVERITEPEYDTTYTVTPQQYSIETKGTSVGVGGGYGTQALGGAIGTGLGVGRSSSTTEVTPTGGGDMIQNKHLRQVPTVRVVCAINQKLLQYEEELVRNRSQWLENQIAGRKESINSYEQQLAELNSEVRKAVSRVQQTTLRIETLVGQVESCLSQYRIADRAWISVDLESFTHAKGTARGYGTCAKLKGDVLSAQAAWHTKFHSYASNKSVSEAIAALTQLKSVGAAEESGCQKHLKVCQKGSLVGQISDGTIKVIKRLSK